MDHDTFVARHEAEWARNSYESAKSRLFPALVAERILTQQQVDSILSGRLATAERLEAEQWSARHKEED